MLSWDTRAERALRSLVEQWWTPFKACSGPGDIKLVLLDFPAEWECKHFFRHIKRVEGMYAIHSEWISCETIYESDGPGYYFLLTVKCVITPARRNPHRAARPGPPVYRPFHRG